MKAKGISEDAIRMIEPGLIDWMDRFHISEDNVIYTVNFLRHHPFIPKRDGSSMEAWWILIQANSATSKYNPRFDGAQVDLYILSEKGRELTSTLQSELSR